MEDEFNCSICLEIAENAVETSCCHHLFCEVCLNRHKSDECPQCRRHFKALVSHIPRRIIGNMPTTCPYDNCGVSLCRADLSEHQRHCDKRTYTCPKENCDFPAGNKTGFLLHLIDTHGDMIVENAHCMLQDHNVQNDMITGRDNDSELFARLGENAKFYCEGILEFDCECCNGYCGPSNGCNCKSCMKLDIKARNLPKNYYLNRQGAVCRISNQTGLFYCGRMVMQANRECNGYCGPGNGPQCLACERMQSQYDTRYAGLW